MSRRMAYNPISFYLTAEGWHPELAPPLPTILKTVKDAGYDGIHAEIPAEMSAASYLQLLNEHGLDPAPGYFQASFGDTAKLAQTIDAGRRLAAEHAKLGLDRIFIADQFGADANRLERPALGVGSNLAQLNRITDGLRQVATAMAGEGVVACLHAHVGTLIETVDETEFMLDRIDRDVLLLGPDTGHLSWAGADLVEFLAKHASRVGAVHVKDYRREVAEAVRATGKGYHDAGAAGIWTEPGRGSIDLDHALSALGDFDGWFIVEVDIVDQPTVAESARLAAKWLRSWIAARDAAAMEGVMP